MEKKAIIRNYAFEKMSNIEKIVFLNNTNNMPDNAEDFSETRDGSVMGWYNQDKSIIYIAPMYGDKIYANKNSSYMFAGCFNLSEIDGIKNLDTSDVESMHAMFMNCKHLKTLNLSTFSTCKVKDMSYMFYGCIRISNINLSKFKTSRVINMELMFDNCTELEVLNCSGFNTSKVKYMDHMFYGCEKLKDLNITLNFHSVVTMENMFGNCKNLTLPFEFL